MNLTCGRFLAGTILLLLTPIGVWAQSNVASAHRAEIDLSFPGDDPTSIPLMVSVDHPMAPDHYIKSLEVSLETDSVPEKGTFLLTPTSGRASVAYPIRSCEGGELKVVVECTRHGRSETTQWLRAAHGGCALPLGTRFRKQTGPPSIRTNPWVRPGEVIPVWVKMPHSSYTGLIEKHGKFVQAQPPFYLERMAVFLGDQRVSEFLMTSAVSPNPQVRFFVKAEQGKLLRVIFSNNKGDRWEVSHPLR